MADDLKKRRRFREDLEALGKRRPELKDPARQARLARALDTLDMKGSPMPPKNPARPGRPKTAEDTTVIAVRVPVDLQARLDRYLDKLEVRTGLKGNRSSMTAHALRLFLDAQEAENAAPTHQDGREATETRPAR